MTFGVPEPGAPLLLLGFLLFDSVQRGIVVALPRYLAVQRGIVVALPRYLATLVLPLVGGADKRKFHA
jgi:hypothetical protein